MTPSLPLYEPRILWLTQLAFGGLEFDVPRFQRGFVWTAEDAIQLVETMLSGLPVGGVVLWERPGGKILVIDGQQRLSTLRGLGLRGESTPELCVALDDAGGVSIEVGCAPGRVPIRQLLSPNFAQAIALAGVGGDPGALEDLSGDGFFALYGDARGDGGGRSLRHAEPLAEAARSLQRAALPALVFGVGVREHQIAEAFRRFNLGGAPISEAELRRLLTGEDGAGCRRG